MAEISNKAVFECRPATGNDLNGGGFVTTAGGTDWSQQAAAQVTFNGTTVTATTVGAGATITITGYTVLATDVGNFLRIASGTNYVAGLYQILSVNTGANTWTLNKNVTTGAGTAMVGRMGGALASLVQFFADADANANPGGYTCYAVGTFTLTAAIVIAGNYNTNVNGGSTSATLGGVSVIGYTSSRGDNGQATMTTATNSVDLLHFSNGCTGVNFYNFNFTTSAGTVGMGVTPTTAGSNPTKLSFTNCKWTGFKRAIWTDGPNNNGAIIGLYLRNCVVTASTTDAIVNCSLTVIIDSYIFSNTGDGVRMEAGGINPSGPLICKNTVFYNNTGKGIYNISSGARTQAQGITCLFNCALVSNGVDGYQGNVAGNNGCITLLIENCIAYGNTGFGINGAVLYNMYLGGNNAFGSNGSGAYGGSLAALSGDVTLSGDPFNGRTSNDFSLNATAGAGAACKQVGFPGVLQSGGTGFADIGPLSPQASAGSTTISVECNTSIVLNRGGVAGY